MHHCRAKHSAFEFDYTVCKLIDMDLMRIAPGVNFTFIDRCEDIIKDGESNFDSYLGFVFWFALGMWLFIQIGSCLNEIKRDNERRILRRLSEKVVEPLNTPLIDIDTKP